MWAYILRRLLLIIPTLVIILLVNFVIVQAADSGEDLRLTQSPVHGARE